MNWKNGGKAVIIGYIVASVFYGIIGVVLESPESPGWLIVCTVVGYIVGKRAYNHFEKDNTPQGDNRPTT